MADIASTDVTVSVIPRDRNIAGAAVGKNLTLASVTFGTGALTYPTGGVPMPAIGAFGFHKAIDAGFIQDPVADGFFYKYDAANRKIKIFTQGFTSGATAVGAAETGALVLNSAGAEGTARMPNTAINTAYDMGGMIELPTAITLAARTIKMLLIGE